MSATKRLKKQDMLEAGIFKCPRSHETLLRAALGKQYDETMAGIYMDFFNFLFTKDVTIPNPANRYPSNNFSRTYNIGDLMKISLRASFFMGKLQAIGLQIKGQGGSNSQKIADLFRGSETYLIDKILLSKSEKKAS